MIKGTPFGLKSRLVAAAALTMAVWFLGGCARSGPPYSPQEALETFQIEDGFSVELFAAEPDVVDPVAMEMDELGRIYVAENSGYPLDTDGAVGRVKLLEDTDGDGLPDRTTVFAGGLTMPTGVMAWKKGVLVTDPPDVLYFEDTNGDGRSDVRKVVLTGFAFANPQHTVSSPVYGLDNWIYLSHEGYSQPTVFTEKFGHPGDVIHYPERPDGPRLDMSPRSLRFRPDTFQLEYLAGPSQFGQTFDRWGRLFTHNNSNHIRHEVVAPRYLERNPALQLSRPWHDVSDHGNAADVYPITIRPRFEILSGAGQITSACGLTLYLGGTFPSEFENVSFVAEPVHNLVHRDVLSPNGATFVARRARENEEFLASTDRWFRPVNFYIGPDGALYVLDYYREVIEHPEWTSAEVYESDDIYLGNNRGRIYRIVPDRGGGLPRETTLRLGEATDIELVGQLENPNIWWRRTAQRLLVDRQSTTAVEALQDLVRQSPSAVARVHALWTLDGLGKLDAQLVEEALGDAEAGVRENALILAEKFLAQTPALIAPMLKMAEDPDPRARFQSLATLGYVDTKATRAVRDRLLLEGIEDAWLQVAALSWPSSGASSLLAKARAELTDGETEGRVLFFRRLAAMIGFGGKPAEVGRLLQAVTRVTDDSSVWWREASLGGLATALERGAEAGLNSSQQDALLSLAESPNLGLRRAALSLLEATELHSTSGLHAAVRRAAATAGEEGTDPDRRADAIRLLALIDPTPHEEMLRSLLDAKTPELVQRAAVRAYGQIEGEQVATFLLENWRSMTGPVRAQAANALYQSQDRVVMLVEAIERGDVQPGMLTARQRNRLIMQKDPALRERARRWVARVDEDRRAIVGEYQAALELAADEARGREVFERACAKCHVLNGSGKEVGPDLTTIQSRPASLILEEILMPNRSITESYEAYVVETADGRTIDGVIGPQGPTFVTLRHEDGEEDVIARKDIKRMYAMNLSAMPADLENQVSIQQMADLLRYIKLAR